jgi:hypothetical protein
MIVDLLGRVVAEGGEKGCIVSSEIQPDFVKAVREDFRVLDDRVF